MRQDVEQFHAAICSRKWYDPRELSWLAIGLLLTPFFAWAYLSSRAKEKGCCRHGAHQGPCIYLVPPKGKAVSPIDYVPCKCGGQG